MPHCGAVNCSNQCSTNTTDVSYHQFPSNAKTRAIWVKKVNCTEIPKYAFLCSNHFTEDCFDKSYEMYQKFLAKDGKKPSRKLVKGTIPMLFAHNTKVKSRSSSKNRAAKKEQAEVLVFVSPFVCDF